MNSLIGSCGSMFTREFLVGIRRKALQRKVWFSSLDRVERGIINLAVRVVFRVKSVVLGVEIMKILDKLRCAMKGKFVRWMEKYGLYRAFELSRLSVKLGNENAKYWSSDSGFARYLTLLSHNQ